MRPGATTGASWHDVVHRENLLTDDLDSTTPLISHRKYMSTINVDLYSPSLSQLLIVCFSLSESPCALVQKRPRQPPPSLGFTGGCPSPFHSTNRRGRVSRSSITSPSCNVVIDEMAASFTHHTHSPFLHPVHRIHMDQLNNALFRSSRAQQELKRH